MANLFGVPEGTPYAKWPTEALSRLKEGLGRHGALTDPQKKIKDEVDLVMTDRAQTGVDYDYDGVLSCRV